MLSNLLIALVTTLPQDSAATTDTFDLRVATPVGEPVLVEVSHEIALDVGGRTMRSETDIAYVDQHEVLDDELEKAVRTYVRSRVTNDGKNADLPLAGVRLVFEVTDDVLMNIDGPALLPSELLRDLQVDYLSLGLWAPMPESASIGEAFDLDWSSLATVLFGAADVERVDAHLVFDSFDEASSIATLTGSIDAVVLERGLTVTHRPECTVKYDLANGLLASIDLAGESTYSANDQDLGTGTFRCSMRASRDAAATKALKAKPVHRTRVFALEDLGLELELPSSWAISESDNSSTVVLFPTLCSGLTAVECSRIAFDNTDLKAFVRAVGDALEGNFGKPKKSESIRSPLGKGHAFTFFVQDEDGADAFVYKAYLPFGDVWVLLDAQGPREQWKDVEKDFVAASKSVREVTQ